MLGSMGSVSPGLHAHQSESHSSGTPPAQELLSQGPFGAVAPLYWSSLSLSKNI